MTTLNERILAIRKHKLLKQNEFAELIGVSRSTLSEVESGKTKPSADILVGMANKFEDINTDWLLTGEGEMYRAEIEDAQLNPISEQRAQAIVGLYEALSEAQQKEILAVIEEKKRMNQLEERLDQLQKKIG